MTLPKKHAAAHVERVKEAARLHFAGWTFDQIAAKFKLPLSTVAHWKARRREIWDKVIALARENQRIAAKIPRPPRDWRTAYRERRRNRFEGCINETTRLRHLGWSYVEIAKRLKVSTQTIYHWKRCRPEQWAEAERTAGQRLEQKAQTQPAPRQPSGITPQTRSQLVRAANLTAAGWTIAEIAKRLSVHETAIPWWRREYPALWNRALAKGESDVVAVVRQMAGTDAMLFDPRTFLRMARAAYRHTEKRGKPLYPKASNTMTLAVFFEQYYMRIRGANLAASTVAAYRNTIRLWVLITGDPALKDIDATTLARFRDMLAATAGIKAGTTKSPNTVRSYLGDIQMFLDFAGPRGPRRRAAASILPEPPYVDPPAPLHRMRYIPGDADVGKCYEAAARMTKPELKGINPPDFWRALLVLTATTGLRRGTLFKLRLDWVDWQARQIIVPAEAMKGRREFVVPLTKATLGHLEKIRQPARELLFPLGMDVRWFGKLLHDMQNMAGIPLDKHFGLHGLRRSLASKLAAGNLQVAQHALGHSSSMTTLNHYVATASIVRQAVDSLAMPEAFAGST